MISRTVQWLLGCLLIVIATAAPIASADEIALERVAVQSTDDGYVLSADFEFELNTRLEEALRTGLSLYFVFEVEMTRSRWYWFDDRAVQKSLTVRLWYHALTRQYRLASGALSQSFATLSEAHRALARLRGWTIADRAGLRTDTVYICFVRMRLDNSKLPRPLQVSVAGNRDWTLTSTWHRWMYQPTPPAGGDAAAGDKPQPDKPPADKP